MSMPDNLVLYGSMPKPLTHVPMPGEMFAYIYQEKYLVRAVRLDYECRDQNNSTDRFGAMLIDIGCVVRIDIKSNYRDLYAVTQAAKIIPAYAKKCHLAQIPPKLCVYDLLHTRVHYKVLCNDGNQMFVNIVSGGVNPFAVELQKEWNFYMYFFGGNLYTMTPSKRTSARHRNAIECTKPAPPVKQHDNNFNPFANPSQYEIKSIAITPLNDKQNPFYYDLNESDVVSTKPKFINFQLTKILNNLSEDWIDKNLSHNLAAVPKIGNNKSLNKVTHDDHITSNQLNDFKQVTQMKSTNAPDGMPVQTTLISKPQKYHEPEKTIQNRGVEPNNQRHRDDNVPKSNVSNGKQESFHHVKPVNTDEAKEKMPSAPQTKPIKPAQTLTSININGKKSALPSADYPQPKKLPAIGDQLTILYEYMENVEQFYAVIRNDSTRNMEVDDFCALMNKMENTKSLVQYNSKRKPKLFDKVIAKFEKWYCRAKIVKVIDEHVFQVYFVDYGNCAKVQTLELFEYNDKWDKYPAYALHFRVNGIKETNPYDQAARQAIEQIMTTECEATVVDIEYSEKLNRNTYVVDLLDENGLNVAQTLLSKNMVLRDENLANHASTQRAK